MDSDSTSKPVNLKNLHTTAIISEVCWKKKLSDQRSSKSSLPNPKHPAFPCPPLEEPRQAVCLPPRTTAGGTHLKVLFHRLCLGVHKLFSEFKQHFFAVFQMNLWFPGIVIRGIALPPDFVQDYTL